MGNWKVEISDFLNGNYVSENSKNWNSDNYIKISYLNNYIIFKNKRGMYFAKSFMDYKEDAANPEIRLTEDEQKIKDKYMDLYGSGLLEVFYLDNYKCINNQLPKIKGDISKPRCCINKKNEVDNNQNYLKFL